MPAARLTGPLWPLRPPPLPDELLSSWMTRLGTAHGISWRAVALHMNVGSTSVPPDVDYILWPVIRDTLALRTGRSPDEVNTLTLKSFLARLGTNLARQSTQMPHWITRLGWVPAGRRRGTPREFFGLHYCPLCLASDPVPYFRQAWRLAWPVCVTHSVVLVDRCHVCGHAVGPVTKRTAKGGPRKVEVWNAIRLCAYCAAPRSEAPALPVTGEECAAVSHWLLVLTDGRVTLPDGSIESSHEYLGMARRIAELLSADGPEHDAIRETVQRRAGIHVPRQRWQTEYQEIESAAIETRRPVLRAVAWLMAAWPERLLDVCLTSAGHRSLGAHDGPFGAESEREDRRWALLSVSQESLDATYFRTPLDQVLHDRLRERYTGKVLT